jgi:collagenase-like PrtC family protease
MKYSIGYQNTEKYEFLECIEPYREHIREVYFPWLMIPDGRGITVRDTFDQKSMEYDLSYIHNLGIDLNLLINGNCYGGKAISCEFKEKIIGTISYLEQNMGLESVTTTSLFAAKIIQETFPHIDVRASINMSIRSIQDMKYVSSYFDSFYIGRELNRSLEDVRATTSWCHDHEKKCYILANSGCLANCSAHTFHDNLVSHEHEVSRENNAISGFHGICWKFFAKKENQGSFLSDSTWVRPEDIPSYEGIIDGIKLATRTNKDPKKVIEAYTSNSYVGNMLSLCEPDFSGMKYLDNKALTSLMN